MIVESAVCRVNVDWRALRVRYLVNQRGQIRRFIVAASPQGHFFGACHLSTKITVARQSHLFYCIDTVNSPFPGFVDAFSVVESVCDIEARTVFDIDSPQRMTYLKNMAKGIHGKLESIPSEPIVTRYQIQTRIRRMESVDTYQLHRRCSQHRLSKSRSLRSMKDVSSCKEYKLSNLTSLLVLFIIALLASTRSPTEPFG